jgi:phosphatidylglycerophosphatase C
VKKRIAFFDFDGTITTKDTLLEFIKFSKGNLYFYFGFFLNSPWLLAYKLKVISNQMAKQRVLTFFFGGMQLQNFQKQCDRFAAEILPGLIRSKAREEIVRLQGKGAIVVIISASPQNWIRGWADAIHAELIATRLQVSGSEAAEKLTGKIDGKNCYGKEKVRRIQEVFNLTDFEEIYSYGDSPGDQPMLHLGNRPFFKPFR